MSDPDRRWQHPWLRVELATRAVLAERLTRGGAEPRDLRLLDLIAQRKAIARAGWFN
jgi:hypothetical protein